ncbi:LapA family protein [Paeniglutamicibacter antarcticus]
MNRADGFFSRLTAKNWVAILGAIAALVFILQNRQRVRIDLLFLNVNAPLWIFLGAVLLIGWLIGRFSFRRR